MSKVLDIRTNEDGSKFAIVQYITRVGTAKRIMNSVELAQMLAGTICEGTLIVNVKTKPYDYQGKTLTSKNIAWYTEEETKEQAYNRSVKADQRADVAVVAPVAAEQLAEVI